MCDIFHNLGQNLKTLFMRPEYKITLVYLVIGILWIYFSDYVVQLLFGEPTFSSITFYQTLKGFFYVSITALVLLLMIKYYYSKISDRLDILNQKEQVEKKLIQTNRFYKAIITNSYDGVLVYGEDRIIHFASQSANRILGYTDNFLEGKSVAYFTHEDDRTIGDQDVADLLCEKKDNARFRLRMKRKNNDIVWVEVIITLWKEEFKTNSFIANFRDITEQIEKERFDKLKLSILSDLNNSNTLIAYRSILTRITRYYSISAAELWLPNLVNTIAYEKCNVSNTLSTKDFKTFQHSLSNLNEELVNQTLENNTINCIEKIDLINDATTPLDNSKHGIYSMIAFPIQFASETVGIVLYYTTQFASIKKNKSLQDIHSILSVDINRRQTKQIFDSILTVSKDILCMINREGVPKWFNPAFERTLGYSIEELVSNSIVEYATEEDKAITSDFIQEIFSGNLINPFIHRVVNKNGKVIWLSWSGIQLGNQGVAILSSRDITTIKQSEIALNELNLNLAQRAKELETSNNVLEEFVNIVSFDLQEPLRMISNFLSLLEVNYQSILDEKAQKYIYYATDGANRMSNLLADLLSYSKVKSSELNYEPIDLIELIDNAKVLLRSEIADKKVKFAIKDLPVVSGSRALINQLLQQLLSNAIKHANVVSPEIEIGAFDDVEHGTVIYIRDNGQGIKEEFHESIFLIFQKTEEKETKNGFGIGLAICKRIIEIHNGKIWIESGKGSGTTFFFTLNTHTVKHMIANNGEA